MFILLIIKLHRYVKGSVSEALWLTRTLEWIWSTLWTGFMSEIECYFSVLVLRFWLFFCFQLFECFCFIGVFCFGFVWGFLFTWWIKKWLKVLKIHTHTTPSLWLCIPKFFSVDILLYHHLGWMKCLWSANSLHIMLSYWYFIWSIHFCCPQCVDKLYIVINAHCN